MTHDNVELVRKAFEGFTEEGWESAKELYSPHIVWEVRRDLPDAEIYTGHAGVARLRARFAEVMDDTWVEPLEFIRVDDGVVVPLRWGGRAKGSGIEFEETHETWLFTVDGSKVARVREFATREQALEAAELSE
jgi:ketosteroid isomerase-like protein